jgi:coenzyme F420-reducing hydrogenase beta subunit
MKAKKGGLLNYTTKIEVSKTIAEIQDSLVKHGAKSIMANYTDQGTIEALSFMIVTPEKKVMAIRLPCDPNPVYKVLEKQYYENKIPRKFVEKDQALRVAWRIVKDWVEAQMALLETQMVKMEQVFLPYAIVRGGKTLFEAMKNDNFKLLEAKIESSANTVEEGVLE